MYDQLPTILQLQKVDSEIDKLESIKKAVPVKLRALDNELERYKKLVQEKEEALEELQKERRSKDRQLNVQQAQIEKYKKQRLNVKSNKEYTALEFEISELEESTSNIEDEIIELMISIDEATDELEAVKKELKEQEEIYKTKKEEILSEIADLDEQIAEKQEERDSLADEVNPSLMSRYNNWRKRRGTSMVAVIEGQACGGCHLTLPPQLVNDVRKRKELYTCNSCGRILYWMDDEELAKFKSSTTSKTKLQSK